VAKMVLCNTKKPKLLDQKRGYLNTLKFRLFTDVTGGVITGTTQAGDFTEVVDTGYPSGGTFPNFATPSLNGSNQAEATSSPITWTFNYSGGTPFTIKGYYATDVNDGGLVLSQFAASPVSITGAGQTYTLIPKMLDDTMP